jgi:hypothetical protein
MQLLNEIDQEVMEVNSKTEIKAMGRTGRFSRILPQTSKVGDETSSIGGPPTGIVEPIYSKKLNMTAK